jgi:hypothetical protein
MTDLTRFVSRHGKRIEVETLNFDGSDPQPRRKPSKDQHFGCPPWWLPYVLPVLAKSDELAVAIYLWRRRAVCGCEPFDVPNGELKVLGISRKIKYRTLKLLEAAAPVLD